MAGPSKQGPSSRRPTGRSVDGRARGTGRSSSRPAASTRTNTRTTATSDVPVVDETAASPRPAAAGPARTRRGQRRWTGRAAILVIILAALVVSYASSLRAWVDQQQQISALRTEQAERSQRVDELNDQIDRWDDPAYVKAQARQRFGYVMPGEVGYAVIDDKPESSASTGATKQKSEAATPWWQQLWGSVDAADGPKTDGSTPAPTPTPTPSATPTPTPEKTLRPTSASDD